MVLVPRWQRPGTNRSLGNHEGRIRALERHSRGGDYVFLQETALDMASTELDIASIDQGYQHLVLEVLLQGDPANPPSGQTAHIVANDFFGVDWGQTGVDANTGSRNTAGNDEDGVAFDQLLPDVSSPTSLFMMATIKFLYYARSSLVKGCVWQGVSIVDGSENIFYASGGGLFAYDVSDDPSGRLEDPITDVKITVPGLGARLAAGSTGQLYGIRKS